MRFKAGISNANTFTKFIASLSSLGQTAWVRLSDEQLRFTVIPEQGTQVWAVLQIDTIFDTYSIQSAADGNVINLEVQLAALLRALRSAAQASSASIRLSKRDKIPLLKLTIRTLSSSNDYKSNGYASTLRPSGIDARDEDLAGAYRSSDGYALSDSGVNKDLEITVTHDVPIRVIRDENVEGRHEPRCREPDVHILMPPLIQLKAISDRFTKLAVMAKGSTGGPRNPKLEIWANMHGCLRLGLENDAMNIASVWTGLTNPELDPEHFDGGEVAVRMHPSTRMKDLGRADGIGDQGWAKVRIDGRDWSRVLSVGRLGGRVIACFCHEHALILYVYLNTDDTEDDSVLTYYISSYSA